MVCRVRYHFYLLEMTEHILQENRMWRLLANASQLASHVQSCQSHSPIM